MMDKETRILVAKRSAEDLKIICETMRDDPDAYLELLGDEETRESYLIEKVLTTIAMVEGI